MGTIHRQSGQGDRLDWEGIPVESYGGDSGADGIKRVLIGQRDGAHNFCIRYFEIPPGSASSLDKHAHDHGIYVLKGRARVLIGSELTEVTPGDVIYISPGEHHQFTNPGPEPFGMLCVAPPKD